MRKHLLLNIVTIAILAGCGGGDTNTNSSAKEVTKAFFGDKLNNRVVIVDVENMKLATPGFIDTGHKITYTADKVFNQPKSYVVNRGSNAIDVVDTNTLELTKTIALEHYPRSAESMNKSLGLCEVTGMDKPMASIIDVRSDEVIAVVGEQSVAAPMKNHGGSHATGHPFWLDAHHFILSNRAKRTLSTYFIEKNTNDVWVTKKLNEINTTTSIHQIIPGKGNYHGDKNFFYGTAEGSGSGSDDKYPSIIEFELTPEGLVQRRELSLKIAGVEAANMGIHHGDFHPEQKLIYVGSKEGTLFIVNYETMTIHSTLQAGKWAGHTTMIPQRNLAIVVNHKDTFVTLVDTRTNTKIGDVDVSSAIDAVNDKTIQAHPKYHVSKDARYFYSFLTEEGLFYELDLDTYKVTRLLDVGGKPAQGSFVKY